MKSIVRQIFDESVELGKNIVRETAKVPGDILMPKKEDPKQPEQKREQPTVSPRQWLEQKAKKPEPTIFDRKNREEAEKKEAVKKQAQAAEWQSLPNTGSAPKRGDPRNIAKQQAGTETSQNARND